MASLARGGWTLAALFTASAAALSVLETHSRRDEGDSVREVVLVTSRLGVNHAAPVAVNAGDVEPIVSYDDLARRSLGEPCPARRPTCTNHWEELSPDERSEIRSLLQQVVERSLQKQHLAAPFPLHVDYVVRATAEGPRVVDVVTEGSSMTKSYYDQLHRMLTTPGQGYPYVVRRLRAKIARR